MLIVKFGGTSVGSVENIKKVKNILVQKNEPFVVVVSAFSGVTNQLQALAENAKTGEYIPHLSDLRNRHVDVIKSLFKPAFQTDIALSVQQVFVELDTVCSAISSLNELSDKTLVKIMSKGELLSSLIIYRYLKQEGLAVSYLSSQNYIVAGGDCLNASVDKKLTSKNCAALNRKESFVAPGFIAANKDGETVLLGRGGSDYTATVFADALNACCVELWSDVDGMLDANPRLVQNAKSIRQMSYAEAFEMAYFGAKVLYPPAIEPLIEKEIPVYLKNTLKPDDEGTLVCKQNGNALGNAIGVSSLNDITLITVSGVALAGTTGAARRVFHSTEIAGANVILISQCCSEQSICIGIRSMEVSAVIK